MEGKIINNSVYIGDIMMEFSRDRNSRTIGYITIDKTFGEMYVVSRHIIELHKDEVDINDLNFFGKIFSSNVESFPMYGSYKSKSEALKNIKDRGIGGPYVIFQVSKRPESKHLVRITLISSGSVRKKIDMYNELLIKLQNLFKN